MKRLVTNITLQRVMCNLRDNVDYLVFIQSLPCLNKVILFSWRAPIHVQSADR